MARRDDTPEMATGATATLEAPTTEANGTAPAADAATATTEAPKRTRRKVAEIDPNDPNALIGVMVRVPQGLKKQLDETAKTQDVSTPQVVVRMLAEAYDYTLPKMETRARAKKYRTEEERKEAQKTKRDADRLRTKAILSAVDEGLLGDIDIPALIARIKAEEAAKQAAASDGAGAGATTEAATAGAAS